MTFLKTPNSYTPDEFRAELKRLKWKSWRPKFIVVHNTAVPSLAQWPSHPEQTRVANLISYYKGLKWHSGPHLFISPNKIWQSCDMEADGVSVSCWNSIAFGVEMVGDYSKESFSSGDGAKVRDLTVDALASLHLALGLKPDDYVEGVKGLHFHKECKRDHHDCPGKNVDKADLVARIIARMNEISGTKTASDKSVKPVAVTAKKPIETSVSALSAFEQKATVIYDFWRNAAKVDHKFAVAMVAQAERESSFNEKAVGDHGGAFGLHQHHMDRIILIRDGNKSWPGCGIDISKLPTVENQLHAIWHELQHSEHHAKELIEAASSVNDAGFAACKYYERPANAAEPTKRGEVAVKWDTFFTGKRRFP